MAELIHEAFLSWAARTPQATALVWSGGQMTYGRLAEASEVAARQLREAGVRAESLVGVGAGRSPELIVALLGIMRSGGAWLPLDPSYPAQRLAYLVEDSGVRLLIGDVALPIELQRIDLSTPGDVAADLSTVDAADLAYVIYTSGSTGLPKGVEVPHGAVAATVAGMREAFGVDPGSRVLQFASPNFDASVCEIGIALMAGATLVLADAPGLLPGPDLVALLRKERVSHAVLPPSVVAAMPDEDLPDLRTLVCAGEALPESLAARWGRGRRLINAYGPTETAICATAGEVKPGERPNIGHALLPEVRLSVVDSRLRQVPAGEVGELVIGGVGVARGYLRRPDLTSERFIDDPAGGHRYRTGDLVRELPDGRFDFVGRADQQIKLHGYRIEPDEIASVLRGHPSVRDAVVVLRDSRLVGYVASDVAAPGVLRNHCAERLPSYMVPAAFVTLAALPLTPSGKVDRGALPAPDRASAGLGEAGAVGTPAQAKLAKMVAELVGVAEVGVDDDFFALGGHSLLVGQLAARIRTEFGVQVPLTALYQAPTVAGMAQLIDDGPGVTGPPVPPPLQRASRDEPLPLSFPQERVWFLEKFAPANLAYQAQATIRLQGPLDVAAFAAALNEIVRRHEIFRTRFIELDGVPAQRAVAAVQVELPVVDFSHLPEEERGVAADRLIGERVRRRPFKLDEPPLATWLLMRLGPDEHMLLHHEHHLVHDGWSFAVFADELGALYEAYLAGKPSPLPEPELQFADLAAWQRNWLTGDVLDAYVSHWAERLTGAPAALELPTDRPRPPVFSFAGDAVQVDFDPQEYERLRVGARAQGVTLFTLMLAGFATVLSRYAQQEDLVIGVGAANRRLAEAERLIGMIINSLPLRVDLSGDPDFATVLRRVHETAVDAYAWQDVPLDRLVDALASPRDPARNPLFSALFSFHDAAVPDLTFGGLRGEVQVRHNGSAKADLNIVVIPRAEQRVGRAASEEDGTLTLIWEYATDLFDAGTMRSMVAGYRQLLTAALDEPSTPLSRLPLAPLTAPATGSWPTVRGFRVSLGQVRDALLAYPGVSEATVVAKDGALIAYVVGSNVDAAKLRSFLADRMPGYQVPTAYVELPALPHDEADLPAPVFATEPAGASSPTEEQVARICAQLLGVPTVSIHDDFFMLGGRSLLAAKLTAQVNREFRVEVPVATFLRRPTVAVLASAVDEALAGSDKPGGLRSSTRRATAELLDSLDELTDEQVAALLQELEVS